MSVSRRNFLGSATALGILGTFLSPEELQALQQAQQEASNEPLAPHDSPGFWGGFYDSALPKSPDDPQAGASRGADTLVNPALETQYLHFKPDEQKLRYAYSIPKEDLLDHDGDVAASILLNQYHPSSDDAKHKIGSQLRVDTVQNHPFMNILAPLAWTAMASLQPNSAGKFSLDQLGFKSDQVMTASSNILLTKGSGKIAVNISQAPHNSAFLKVLSTMISHANLIAPFFVLPAVSVPAMSAFSEAFSYWEDRTKFLLNGNLINAYATKQAMADPTLKSPEIGLLAGDYVMVAKKDTAALESVISNLTLTQGYLLHKGIDLSQTSLENALKDTRNPDITYATVKVGITPITGSAAAKPAPVPVTAPATPTPAKKKPAKP
jgi:hypothetical protein